MISIVINSLGRGGAELSVLALMQELVRRGRQVKLICLFPMVHQITEPEELRGHVVRLEATSFVLALRKLKAELRRQRPDLVFSLMPQANLAAVIIGRWLRLPVLSSERTSPAQFYKPRTKLMLALLPHVLSQHALFISNHALKAGLPADSLGRQVRRRASVLHNPIPARVPASLAAATRAGRLRRLRAWAANPLRVEHPLELLVASRLVAGKGVPELLESAHAMLATGLVRLTIAGTGPLQASLEDWVQTHGIAGQVTFGGFVENMDAVYADADVVVLNSASEGFGRVGFEAYMAGCLVLGTINNSFIAEVAANARAWHVSANLNDLRSALVALSSASIDAKGDDIAALQRQLSIEHHTDRFLQIVKDDMHLDC